MKTPCNVKTILKGKNHSQSKNDMKIWTLRIPKDVITLFIEIDFLQRSLDSPDYNLIKIQKKNSKEIIFKTKEKEPLNVNIPNPEPGTYSLIVEFEETHSIYKTKYPGQYSLYIYHQIFDVIDSPRVEYLNFKQISVQFLKRDFNLNDLNIVIKTQEKEIITENNVILFDINYRYPFQFSCYLITKDQKHSTKMVEMNVLLKNLLYLYISIDDWENGKAKAYFILNQRGFQYISDLPIHSLSIYYSCGEKELNIPYEIIQNIFYFKVKPYGNFTLKADIYDFSFSFDGLFQLNSKRMHLLNNVYKLKIIKEEYDIFFKFQ